MLEAIEQVAEDVLSEQERAIYVQRLAVGAEEKSATSIKTEGCASKELKVALRKNW